jgi:hypothetical protein
MIYLKSIAVGIAAAIAAVLVPLGAVVIGTYAWLQFEISRQVGQESGGIGAVSVGLVEGIVIVALILGVFGFVAGFRWGFRRLARKG